MRRLFLIAAAAALFTASPPALATDGNLACVTKAGAVVRCPALTDGTAVVGDSAGVYGFATSTSDAVTVGNLTVTGNTAVGNAGSDTLEVFPATVTLDAATDHAIAVEAAATTGDGKTLTVTAGNGGPASDTAGGAYSAAGGDGISDGAGGAASMAGGAAPGAGAGGAASLLGGNSTGGTDGVVNVGTSNTSAVNVAASTIPTTVKGTLNVDEATTLDSTLGVTGDVTLTTGAARTVKVGQAATTGNGNNLAVEAAQGGPASNTNGGALAAEGGDGVSDGTGGAASLAGGAAPGTGAGGAASVLGGNSTSGIDGAVNLGTSNTSAVNVSATTIVTTVKGPMNVDEAVTLDSTLGVTGDVTLTTGAARTFKVGQGATTSSGNNLTVEAGQGGPADNTAGGLLALEGGDGVSDGTGGAATITGGAGPGTGNGGAITINGGSSSGGTDGAISIGVTRGVVGISKSGNTTTVNGALAVTQALTPNGGMTLSDGSLATLNGNTVQGDSATDTHGRQGVVAHTAGSLAASNGVLYTLNGGIDAGDSDTDVLDFQGALRLTAGTISLPAAYAPQMKEYTLTIEHTDLADSATEEDETLSVPAGSLIVGGAIELDTEFSGGSVSALTVSCGIAADKEVLITGIDGAPLDAFTGATPGWLASAPGGSPGLVNPSLMCNFQSVGDNVVNLGAGSLIVHIYYIPLTLGTP